MNVWISVFWQMQENLKPRGTVFKTCPWKTFLALFPDDSQIPTPPVTPRAPCHFAQYPFKPVSNLKTQISFVSARLRSAFSLNTKVNIKETITAQTSDIPYSTPQVSRAPVSLATTKKF